MEKTKVAHTPGPWRVNLTSGFDDDGMPMTGVWVEVEHNGPTSIANLIPHRGVQGNAHLIAAAPDLLAALKAVTETGDDCPMCDRGRLRSPEKTHWPECPYLRAQAVIAKAEGR